MFEKDCSRLLKIIVLGSLLGYAAIFLHPSPASAIPAFARKYNLSCGSCHTKPPRLNKFGEAFHMAGFQIPAVSEGEIHAKRRIGRIMSETNFLNIFAVRTTGNFLFSSGGNKDEAAMVLPQELSLYLAGNVTDGISYFFELEQGAIEIEGTQNEMFEEGSRFGVGKEFFFMMDLPVLLADWGGMEGAGGHRSMNHDSGAMIHGPMVMVGKIDPSTNFSYPTNRQVIASLPGRVNTGIPERFSLAPYAFASKFFGLMTVNKESVEVTRPVLYNTEGDLGVDTHMMIGPVLISAGFMQGLLSDSTDANQKKDPYLMGRVNFGGANYLSGSLSGLFYRGFDTARVPIGGQTLLVDWVRTGVSGNIQYRFLDLYGALIWDALKGLPENTGFDADASGVTLEGDYLITDRTLLSLRYDLLKSGGQIGQKGDGEMITAQTRHYLRENFSFYVRDSYNLEKTSDNPLQSFRHEVALGLDFDF